MFFLYNSSILIYLAFIRLAALFNSKAKLWVNGRIDWKEKLKLIPKNKKTIWMHCASLGEFEQGRPIIEKLKSNYPNHFIVLTFFSPSGFEVRKNYDKVDLVMYLPIDLNSENIDFINGINPAIAIFVKYEFWFGYLRELRKKNIPTILISARFRENQHFFKWYGKWAKNQLKNFSQIHVQDKDSFNLLNLIGYKNSIISGDTRYDRVWENATTAKEIQIIKNWLNNEKCLIAGSTWSADDNIILPWVNKKYKLIIAPHEINVSRIEQLKNKIGKNGILFTELNNLKNENILILNNMGMLLSVYKMGTIAYVGGGFGSGLHNILEPAAFGLPVIFGNKHKKFPEAKSLINAGGGFEVTNKNDFNKVMDFLQIESNYLSASENCKQFVKNQTGASLKIMETINNYI